MLSERRESVMRDNNTAQETLEFLLSKMNPSTKEIVVGESLHGDLDFAILSEKGFRAVSKIEMTKPGEITSLSNLPAELKILLCPDQLLAEFAEPLAYLEELNLEGNGITHFEFRGFPKLKILHLDENHLETIPDVPAVLEELYVNYNRIRTLELIHAEQLRVLHVVGNDMIRIRNVPPAMVDLRFEENPLVEIDYATTADATVGKGRETPLEVDYIESMHAYFRLKREYEIATRDARKTAFEKGHTRKQGMAFAKAVRPKCIHCRRPVGTIFESRERRWIARCGNAENPCELNIQLFRGDHQSVESLVYLFQDQMREHHDSLISQKLDTLFGYVSEDQSAKKFKKEWKDYSDDQMLYSQLKTEYANLHSPPVKREMVRSKLRQIHELRAKMIEWLAEYELSGKREILVDLTEMYVHEYLPEIHNLRLLHYEVMEMVETGRSKETAVYKERELFQKDVALTKTDHITTEPPRVISFQRMVGQK